ncbi:MAG: T9SS type A sorting domain-containing protein [Sphingobacteriales bacterium]|nr:MAG: T9SS type A sorting domain-containing protein [Sphingobacteriales bacterium]
MKKFGILTVIAAFISICQADAQITVNASSGSPSASYSTLKSAFDAINFGFHQGQIVILVTGNTTEPVEAVLEGSGGLANYSHISIRPTVPCTISGNIAGPLIFLKGADNLSIDGRIGGTGSSRSLTIENTFQAGIGTLVSAIRIDSSAIQDTLQFLNLKSASQTLLVGHASAGIQVHHNDFGWSGNMHQGAGIVMRGTLHSITQNLIHDFSLFGISIISAGSTQSTNIEIRGNSLYAPLPVTTTVMYISSSGTGISIKSNYLGGAAAYAGGPRAEHNIVTMIACVGNTTIDSNIVTNLSGTQVVGINSTAGSIGMNQGNIIGSMTDTGAIRGTSVTGIITTAAARCYNNKIGGITAFSQVTGILSDLVSTVTDTLRIYNNIIGGSQASMLKAMGSATATGTIIGMLLSSQRTDVYQNEVSHLYDYSGHPSGNVLRGIGITGGGIYARVRNNQIHNLHALSAQVLWGISFDAGGTSQGFNASGNNIHTIRALNYGSATAYVHGVFAKIAQGSTTIYDNSIASITDTAFGNSNVLAAGIAIEGMSGGTQSIRRNTVSDIRSVSEGVNSTTAGILVLNGAGALTIDSNEVNLVAGHSLNTADNQNVSTQGIGVSQPQSGTIAANVIQDISDISTVPTTVAAISLYRTSTAVPFSIKGNSIFSLSRPGVSGGNIAGILTAGSGGPTGTGNGLFDVINNIVAVAPASNSGLYGIWNTKAATTLKAYHNTVYVAGTTTGNHPSAAFARAENVYTGIDLRNNILINNRTGGSSGHFAILNNSLVPGGAWTFSSHNNLFTGNTGTLASWGGTSYDFASYRAVSLKDSCSLSHDVDFTDLANHDLHLMSTTLNENLRGNSTLGVSTDIDGDPRHPAPAMGADEIEVLTSLLEITPPGSPILCDGDTLILQANLPSVQWYFAALPISGGIGNTLAVTTTGNYSARYEGSCYTEVSNTVSVLVTFIDASVVTTATSLTVVSPGQYQWMDCDNNYASIPAANGQTYTPTQNGNYAVLIAYNGCLDTSDCVNFTMVTVADIDRHDVNVFPNPGSNTVKLTFSNPARKTAIALINTLGQQMMSLPEVNGNEVEINTSQLPSGLYIIRIQGENGYEKSVRWMKVE